MIEALIYGKLSRNQTNMEDVLTSNVFGLLRLLPAAHALIPFLRLARSLDDSTPLSNLEDSCTAEYSFWPRVQFLECHPCEPDVAITLFYDKTPRYLVWVEAKFLSGKSTVNSDGPDNLPYDQLAREWDNLVFAARRLGAEPILIYLTADVSPPIAEIETSRNAYRASRGAGAPFNCLWLSWRDLHNAIEPLDVIRKNLIKLTNRLGLHYFSGVPAITPIATCRYLFSAASLNFRWPAESQQITWRFRP